MAKSSLPARAAKSSGKFALLDELAEEFAARYRRGERPALTEYVDRHPELADDIRDLFPALVQVEQVDEDLHAAEGSRDRTTPAVTHVGDYRVLREVGRGGMGVVYEAEQRSLGRRVALKLLPLAGMKDAKTLIRFQREARAAAKLHHTNIVPVFDVGQDQDYCFYAMQFIQGQALDEIIDELRSMRGKSPTIDGRKSPDTSPDATASLVAVRLAAQSLLTGRFHIDELARASPMPGAESARTEAYEEQPGSSTVRSGSSSSGVLPGRAQLSSIDSAHYQYARSVAHIGLQVAGALSYAHIRGIIHRDIKPSNLLLDSAGVVWVTDFGLAKTQDDGLTNTGDLLGTFRYMAPERFRGQGDARADIYALGLTLYELLVLKAAFSMGDRLKLMDAIRDTEPPRPRSLDPRIPRDLETIVLKAIDKDAARRYGSAEEMSEDLRRFLDDQPVKARRAGSLERAWRWCRRNRAVASLVAAVFLLLTALAVVSSVGAVRLAGALTKAHDANADANVKLWESLLSQARANRMTRQPGQRFETLRAIKKALMLPLPAGRRLDELRTEAIAALLLPDIEVAKEWDGWPEGTVAWTIDSALNRYARADVKGNVSIRQIDGDVELIRLPGTGGGVEPYFGLEFSPDGRFFHHCCESPGGWVSRLWKLDAPQPTVLAEGYGNVAFRPDSRQAATLTHGGILRILDLVNGHELIHHPTDMHDALLRWNPKNNQIAMGTKTQLRIFESDTGKMKEIPWAAGAMSGRLAWHPDGARLAITSGDYAIRLLDITTGLLSPPLEGHKNAGIIFQFNKAGDRLISNDWNHHIRLWDLRTGRQILAHPCGGTVLQFSADDDYLAADLTPPKCRFFRCRIGSEFRTISPELGAYKLFKQPQLSTLLPAGRLAAFFTDREVALVDIVAGKVIGHLPIHGVPVRFEPDGGALWTSGQHGLLRWPIRISPANSNHYQFGPPERIAAIKTIDLVGISSDAELIAAPYYNQGTWLWQRKLKRTLILGPQPDVRDCAISPDGRWVASGSHSVNNGSAAKVWDAASGQLVAEIPVIGPCKLCFSPDGKWLLTTGGGPRLWSVGGWEEGPSLGGSPNNPYFAFSVDSKLLALGDAPGVVRLVAPDTGNELARLSAPESTRLAPGLFTPDGGRLLAIGTESGAIHIFDLRAIRRQLAELGLDWNAPPLPPASPEPPEPVHVEIEIGDFWQKAKADDLVRQSNRLVRDGKHLDAIAVLREAVKADPANSIAHNDLAWVLLVAPKAMRDTKEALVLARKAVELEASSLHLNTLGVALYRNGEFKEALPILERSLDASKGVSDAFDLFFLAMCHQRLGHPEKAHECYGRAIEWLQKKRGSLPAFWVSELTEFQAEADELLNGK